MEKRLAYFEGPWTEEEQRLVEEAIAWKEKRAEFSEDTPGEPWTVIRRDFGERRIFLAQRYGWQAPVKASSPEELATAIRNR